MQQLIKTKGIQYTICLIIYNVSYKSILINYIMFCFKIERFSRISTLVRNVCPFITQITELLIDLQFENCCLLLL